jgi:hypothetical protein
MEKLPYTGYWIISLQQEEIVGYRTCLWATEKVAAFSSFVLPQHRCRGFSSDSALLLSEGLINLGIVDAVIAETGDDNPASSQALINAGFTEVASGLCTTGQVENGMSRRFAKPVVDPQKFRWPLDGPL